MAELTLKSIKAMAPARAALFLANELKARRERDALDSLYPDDGPFARVGYKKHLAMFKAGAEYNQRVAMGGNRVGKTLSIGGYECAVHLTGLYPPWWEGIVYDRPILLWACGTKGIKVRDVNQKMLLGGLTRNASVTTVTGGLIPKRSLIRLSRKIGVSEALDKCVIRHRKGWENVLQFKSYEEGRKSFEAEAVNFIWLDEEPPLPIYDECLLRLLTTRGSLLATFTPVEGMTETVISMLEGTDFL